MEKQSSIDKRLFIEFLNYIEISKCNKIESMRINLCMYCSLNFVIGKYSSLKCNQIWHPEYLITNELYLICLIDCIKSVLVMQYHNEKEEDV